MAVLQGEEVSLARGGLEIQQAGKECELPEVSPQVPHHVGAATGIPIQSEYGCGCVRASKEAEI